MKSKKLESEARRISLNLVADVLENIFDTEMKAMPQQGETDTAVDSVKRKVEESIEEELAIHSRPKRTRTRPNVTESSNSREKNQGVFTVSDKPVAPAEIPKLGTMIKADNVSMVAESNKAILDSLPVIEKLRSLSRTGSIKDEGSVSELGDISDKDSVASGLISRNNRKGKSKKAGAKSNGKGKRNTRSNKGKGRRTIFKKKPVKSLPEAATFTTSDRICHEGQFYNKGDIVSVVSIEDDEIYYAQLRGFLTDQYSDKHAAITWLLPTRNSPPPSEGFHPGTYILGPEEELPRRMEVFTFVMHAPDDYFYNRRAPYRTTAMPADTNFTSTRLGPRLRKNVNGKDIFVGLY